MKLFSIIFAFVAVVSLTQCDKLKNINFAQTNTTGELTIPSGTIGGAYLQEIPLGIDLSKIAADNGTSLDLIKEIKLTGAKAITTFATNFDNFDNLEVSIAADGKPDVVLMSVPTITVPSVSPLVLTPNTTLNFADYFKATNVKLKVKGTIKATLTEEQKIKFELNYNVVGGI